MNLQDAFRQYNTLDIYPFHMPGHKRNVSLCKMDNPYSLDYTEIDYLDDFHEACAHPDRDSLYANANRRASRLFGSKYSFYLINGSTTGLMCSLIACTHRGDKVLIARNCHKSVYNTLVLQGLDPVYVYPSMDKKTGVYTSLVPEDVEKAFEQFPDMTMAVVVSPTFDGVTSNIQAIADIVHLHGALLMVDEAHGPHFGLSADFPDSAVHQGADIVIHSLHKTLPVLTQVSMLHICSDRVDVEALTRTLAMVESSSPSCIFLASGDQCMDLLEQRGDELFASYKKRLDKFSEEMKGLQHLCVIGMGNDSMAEHPNMYGFDRGKLTISCRGTDMTGAGLYKVLLEKYRLQMEMKLRDTVLAMTSIADTDEGFRRLSQALLEIDAGLVSAGEGQEFPNRERAIEHSPVLPYDACEKEGEFIPVDQAGGRIAREFVYAYPPGIPYFVPGETIDQKTLEQIRLMEKSGIRLIGTRHRYPEAINVCK